MKITINLHNIKIKRFNITPTLCYIFFLLLPFNLLNAMPIDTSKRVMENMIIIDKKIKDIDDKLNTTQKDVFNAFNQNIQTMVEAHQKSQNHLSNMYNIIYSLFALFAILLSVGGYLGLKSLKDIKRYSRERIDSLISNEVNNVQTRAATKLQELGLDSIYMMKDIKEIIRLQQLYYQIFQLQGTDIQKEMAINAIINNCGTENDLVEAQLIKLISKNEKPLIRSLSCMAIIISDFDNKILESNAKQILKEMLNGSDNEISAANEIGTRLKTDYNIII